MLEPITLDQAKLHLRVTWADEDSLIGDLIAAARSHCEEELGVKITQTDLVFGEETAPIPPVVLSAMLIMLEYLYRRDDKDVPSAIAALLGLSPFRKRMGAA